MKSYNHLYEKTISETNRRYALSQAKHSKRFRKIMKHRHMSDDAAVEQSLDWIVNYENAEHVPVYIYDGITRKERTIIVPTMEELLVQHCIVNAMKPMFCKGIYEHSYASLPGRGAHKGKQVIEKWIRTDPKNCKYVLKMDIRHFFDTIPHDCLKASSISKSVSPGTQPSATAFSHVFPPLRCPTITLKPLSRKLRLCPGPCTP